ncbi:RNA polymerase sigma factor [Paractinoplanes rishiriensis]|uniref:RNA polymerase sigma factor n=1 Tax=Paractinoplanes rishiriensis TaxID=1050105 RepID=UPI0019452E67|nr:hypothetical protein [Actinoplanes rishiriensis]
MRIPGVLVSASTRRSALPSSARLPESAPPGPPDGPDRLRWLIRRIADDDRDAFVELFDWCSGEVTRRLRRQMSDPDRAAAILAGTFVEVWWLAGCHVDPDTDVIAWIEEIAQRRVADSRPDAASSACPAVPGLGLLGVRWSQCVEVELAGLLGRHLSPPAGSPHDEDPCW